MKYKWNLSIYFSKRHKINIMYNACLISKITNGEKSQCVNGLIAFI